MNIYNAQKQPEPAFAASLAPMCPAQPTSFRVRLLTPFRDSSFGIGLLLLILSSSLFVLYDVVSNGRRGDSSILWFMPHYSLAVWYTIYLLSHGTLKLRLRQPTNGHSARWVGLLLWLLSAYALNRHVAVFQQSTTWLCWLLVLVGAAVLLHSWKEAFSVRVQQLLYMALAIGWWLFVYLAIYVTDWYLVSVPLLLGLGLSAHTFVPLLFVAALSKRLWHDAQLEEHLRVGIYAGLLIPLVIVGLFLSGWISDLNQVEQTRQRAVFRKTSDLPDWLLVAQRLRLDRPVFGWITNRFLLNNRVYDQGHFLRGTDWDMSTLTALDEVRQHDPLVVIASQLYPTSVLSSTEQLSILKVVANNRHSTEEKFWTGRHLTIQDVVSQVRIWPQFRLSYTEQTFRIRNHAHTTTEEALLTFSLPPGSVVSSMSLWINNREEPARLTIVAKADSAYRQVVNVESKIAARDPSVLYWQEGNRITVRVFPCRVGEDRRVKLGITSPLRLSNNQLTYQVPILEGPNAASADELVQVDFDVAPTRLKTPWQFADLDNTLLTHQGRYVPGWTLHFPVVPLSSAAFVLNQQAYRVIAHKPTHEPFRPTDVYLDVNNAWQWDEFTTAYRLTTNQGHSRVWVFDDGLKLLTPTNSKATYERLHEQTFSLFPIYRITHPATALLVTKATPISPSLTDVKGSLFADRLTQFASQTSPIRTFCLPSTSTMSSIPTYLKTLAELRVLSVVEGDIRLLTDLLGQQRFPRMDSDPTHSTLPEAGIVIRATPQPVGQAATAPDHLARLFMYNRLLAQIGPHYFDTTYQTDTLIQQAQQAHVVSPLSSLLVLETAHDYDRFGIKNDRSGLDNATLKEEGAVPEPHEWALIGLLLIFVSWVYWRRTYALH